MGGGRKEEFTCSDAQIVTFKKLKTLLKGASQRFKYAWPFVKFRQGGIPPCGPGGPGAASGGQQHKSSSVL